MKYISFDVKIGTIIRRQVVAFPNDLTHSIMAAGITASLKIEYPKATITVHAAGFTDVIMHEAYGESETLSLKADPSDADDFNTSDYAGHIQ